MVYVVQQSIKRSRVAKVARGHGRPPPKVETWTKILSPNIRYLSRIKICRNLRTFFGDLWAKKVPFWVKTVLLGQEVHYYMVYIAYFTELNSKI